MDNLLQKQIPEKDLILKLVQILDLNVIPLFIFFKFENMYEEQH